MKAAARVFQALADPTRRQILQELKEAELTAGEIVSRFSISAPAISRHLSILEAAELVSERRDGNRIWYSLVPETLAGTLGDFLSAVCPTQIAHRNARKRRS
jgi:DNA-binding transcriptional ArsR family regulator